MKTASPERILTCGTATLRLARYVVDHLIQALGFEKGLPQDSAKLLSAIKTLRNVLASGRAREFSADEQTKDSITFNTITIPMMIGYCDQLESLAKNGTRFDWGK
jgi:hypothetical protein